MSGELHLPYSGASATYAIIRRLSDGEVWDVAAEDWGTWSNADIDDYDIPLVSMGGDLYTADLPAGIESGIAYQAIYYERAGASPAIADLILRSMDARAPEGVAGAAAGTAYAGLADLKTRLSITGAAEDALLTSLIEVASRTIDDDCERFFYQADETRYFDGVDGDLLLIDDCQSITTFTTDSEGDGTWDGETWTEDTDFVLRPENSDPQTRVWIPSWGNYSLIVRDKYVKILGTWGWASVPTPIEQATLVRATQMYRTLGAEEMESESIGDYRYKRYSMANTRERDLLLVNAYRRVRV